MKLPQFEVNDKTVFWGGAITMYAYPLITWAMILLFAPRVEFLDLIIRGQDWLTQVGLGLFYGFGAYLVVHTFIFSGWMNDMTHEIAKLSKKLNWIQIIFLSIAAGVGEELLFRVGLQYFWGIWPTAIVFVAMHGYLTMENNKVLTYGVFMVFVSAGFGYLYVRHGILAAIAAHTLIDLLIFGVLKLAAANRFKPEVQEEKE